RVLNEAGYLPSNTEKYPLGGIVSAIQNAFHATPKLDCSKDAVNELHLCFYKDFKPRDCIIERSPENDNYFSSSSCPKYVSLPVYTSSALNSSEALPFFSHSEISGGSFSSSLPDAIAIMLLLLAFFVA
ncbi:hypothetical protein CICLE_v100162422mg, partial [Citrus x clementina]